MFLFEAPRAQRVVVCLLLGGSIRAGAQTAILQIQVLQGEGSVYAAGTRVVQPMLLQITDETGQPMAGARISFSLPEDGPAGAFAQGLRSAVVTTGADGKASPPAIQWGADSGPVRVRITAMKDQARAGTVVNFYLSPARSATAAASLAPQARVAKKGSGKGRWLLVAAAAAAAGLAVGVTRQDSAAAASATATSVQIGPPAITVGRP
jgi:hypothetical protein